MKNGIRLYCEKEWQTRERKFGRTLERLGAEKVDLISDVVALKEKFERLEKAHADLLERHFVALRSKDAFLEAANSYERQLHMASGMLARGGLQSRDVIFMLQQFTKQQNSTEGVVNFTNSAKIPEAVERSPSQS